MKRYLFLLAIPLFFLARPAHAAISYDNSADGGIVSSASSLTWTQTCSGTNRILMVGAFGELTDVITGATDNGVAMTLVAKIKSTRDRYIYVWYSFPSTGTNTIIVSRSGTGYIAGMSESYDGASQTGQPDAYTTYAPAGASTGITVSLTTIANNSWTILLSHPNTPDAQTAGTGTTFRVNDTDGLAIGDSNGPITPASTYSMSTSIPTSQYWGAIMVSISPATSIIRRKIMTVSLNWKPEPIA